jgi:hypothetical protein
MIPQAMLPFTIQAIPPNVFRSDAPGRSSITSRIRSASSSEYATTKA